MRVFNNLKNPSFDAWNDTDGIEHWSKSSNVIVTQRFGNEELGTGQWCVLLKPNDYVKQRVAYDNNKITLDTTEYDYVKFSCDVKFQNNIDSSTGGTDEMTDQQTSLIEIKLELPYSTYTITRQFTLVSQKFYRISVLASIYQQDFIVDSNIDITITNKGQASDADNTGDYIYVDNCKLEELTIT